MILDADWLAYELQRDAEYVAWLQLNDPARIPGYLRDCDYTARLEAYRAAKKRIPQ